MDGSDALGTDSRSHFKAYLRRDDGLVLDGEEQAGQVVQPRANRKRSGDGPKSVRRYTRMKVPGALQGMAAASSEQQLI